MIAMVELRDVEPIEDQPLVPVIFWRASFGAVCPITGDGDGRPALPARFAVAR